MTTSSLHLNLLKQSELLSSSPVRLRVMLPVGAMLFCVGMLVWWSVLLTQLMIAKTQSQGVEDDLAAKTQAHAEAIRQRDLARELKLQLEQLDYYRAGVRAVGDPLARLAEIVPLRIQIKELSIRPPRAQVLQPPGSKVPLFGPTDNVETQKFVVAGLTTKANPVDLLMDSLSVGFETLVTGEKNVNSFRQDTAEADGRRLLSFEFEYTMPPRRFAK